MTIIVIENQGVAPKLAMRLMGASSKGEKDIGTFGTGMKYGLAGAVRLAGAVEVCFGLERVTIGVHDVELRGQVHRELVANGEPLGITDQLGKGWEPWMFLREFIANAIDEGGHEVYLAEGVEPEEDRTKVCIPLGPFAECYERIDDYFCLHDVPGQVKTELGRAIPKADPNVTRIFKKGVLVKRIDGPSAFDYELNEVRLGEDRIAGDHREALWAFLSGATLEVKRAVLPFRFEAESYQWVAPDPSWREAFGTALVVTHANRDAEDALVVASNFVDVAEAVGARTMKSDRAAKAAARETMPATLTVREACKRLEKVGLKVNPKLVLMAKIDDDVLVEQGIIHVSKDLSQEGIVEALIVAATHVGRYRQEDQIRVMAAIIRRLAKL